MDNEKLKKDQNLIPLDITNEMKGAYIDYAMSVIVSRAIPDVRDGLKPVHRRIIYSMYNAGYFANKIYKKSARIVGDVMGRYHPHNDASIYDALVRMAQDFSLRIPLIKGQGNFGSMDGDAAAAMRYTESMPADIAHFLIKDIADGGAEFVPNYDGLEVEPKVLPSMFPNILVNGSGGIAVGMATNIPPHNISDIIDASCLYIDNNDVTIEELIKIVKAPDFPTGGTILSDQSIQSAYSTGRGAIKYRGKCEIEETDGKQAIIVTEMPYMVNKSRLVEKIADLVRDKKIDGISDLRDESNKDGVRIVVAIKRGSSAEIVLNQLYMYTQLQSSFGVNMLALSEEGLPKVMNIKEIIAAFIRFREFTITKRTSFLLNKAQEKAHILLGIAIAVDNIDEIISIIKSAGSVSEAKEQLMNKKWNCSRIINLINLIEPGTIKPGEYEINLTSEQAKAILEMRLQRLTAMEQDKLATELSELSKEIAYFLEILNDRIKLFAVMKEELINIKNLFGSPRRTNIIIDDSKGNIEDLIECEEMVVTVTQSGYIKRVPLSTYRSQNRGGKGRIGSSIKDEDIVSQVLVGNTHTSILYFSTTGQVYSSKIYDLPLASPQSKGRSIVNLLPLKDKERITAIMKMPDEQHIDSFSIIFATMHGKIRRNMLSDFHKINANGKIAIVLDDGDSLIDVKVCESNKDILMISKLGKALRFPANSLRVTKGRKTGAVRGIDLSKEDQLISMTIINNVECTQEERDAYLSIPFQKRQKIAAGNYELLDNISINIPKQRIIDFAVNEEFILTITDRGFGKRTSSYEYSVNSRACKGIVNLITSTKTGDVVASMPATSDDELVLVTNTGQLMRCKLDDVKVIGRRTSGVVIFKINREDRVVSVSLVPYDIIVDEKNISKEDKI